MKLAEKLLLALEEKDVNAMRKRLEKAKARLSDELKKVDKFKGFLKRKDLQDRHRDYKRMLRGAENRVKSLKSFISDYEKSIKDAE